MLRKFWKDRQKTPRLHSIYLYECPTPPGYKIKEIIDYLKELCPQAKTELRKNFFSFFAKQYPGNIDNLVKEITLCRVHSVNREVEETSPLPREIDYERKRLIQQKQLKGIIYDGFRLQATYQYMIEPKEGSLSSCHIIFTDQFLSTFDENDKRYHLRVGIYGIPNLISTPGPIEALAKPREYYLKLQAGGDPLTLEQQFKEEVINYGDWRINELLKGYCAQAIFYHLSGDLFCLDKNCRLYNAHWQKEALWAQIESKEEFCPRHADIISRWGKD